MTETHKQKYQRQTTRQTKNIRQTDKTEIQHHTDRQKYQTDRTEVAAEKTDK